ncbi:hypothetical protein ACIQMR_13955 [Streptomyces sp. NPDC091376]|uniref:hypothetical protein n=1 Tax=Streptomyces sp. NPDC091376 TaxID=3365994 RepID=UPI0037F355FB
MDETRFSRKERQPFAHFERAAGEDPHRGLCPMRSERFLVEAAARTRRPSHAADAAWLLAVPLPGLIPAAVARPVLFWLFARSWKLGLWVVLWLLRRWFRRRFA